MHPRIALAALGIASLGAAACGNDKVTGLCGDGCPDGYTCQDYECRKVCSDDRGCDSGQRCAGGLCWEASAAAPVCGDGVVDPATEECDAGAANSDAAGSACLTTCKKPQAPSYTFAWQTGAWGACDAAPAWSAYGAYGACSVTCGGGEECHTRTCTGTAGNQTRTVKCVRSDSEIVADGACADVKPAATQACTASCTGAAQECRACNTQACGDCPSAVLTAPTSTAGVTCTDTMDPHTAGWEGFTPRPWGNRCRGAGCSLGNVCSDTPYLGTVKGGSYGTCENYCAVKARCETNGTWTVTGFTW